MPETVAQATRRLADSITSLVDDVVDERLGDTPNPDPKPSGPFTIFEDIRYRNGPNLRSEFGMLPIKLHYEAAFFDDKKRQGAYENGAGAYPLPSLSRVASVAARSPQISCVDIERYWNSPQNNGDEEIDDRAIDAYEAVLEAYDDALPRGHKFGLYSTMPIRSYWPIINGNSWTHDDALWKRSNAKLKPLGELVDMTFPSIYTFYTDSAEDQRRWVKYAAAQITEAKRIAPGKPCYPFLWPTFHSGSDEHKGKPIPRHYFRLQLETCRKHADGVVIWTLAKTKNIDFRDIPDWWNAAEDFARATR